MGRRRRRRELPKKQADERDQCHFEVLVQVRSGMPRIPFADDAWRHYYESGYNSLFVPSHCVLRALSACRSGRTPRDSLLMRAKWRGGGAGGGGRRPQQAQSGTVAMGRVSTGALIRAQGRPVAYT